MLRIGEMAPKYILLGKIKELEKLKELKEIETSCEEISDLIRQRIENMKIIE